MPADAFVSAYQPSHVTNHVWQLVGATVREAILSTTDSEATARRYCSHAAAFASWAHTEGTSATVEGLFSPSLIERYIDVGMATAADSTRATRRSILRRIALHASPTLAGLPKPPPIAYRRLRPPYSATEIVAYFDLARTQPTLRRRQALMAVLTLGLGCGLACEDLGWVRGVDVEVVTTGETQVSVSGGTRPRSVVCRATYEHHLAILADQAGERLLIGGNAVGRHNITSATLGRLIQDRSLPPLVVARLRSTWLLSHLRANTPLPLIMVAAGLRTVRPLEDLLHHLPARSSVETARLLRGTS